MSATVTDTPAVVAPKIPADLDRKLAKGRTHMLRTATLRKECLEFWRGNQYVHRNSANYLVKQGVLIDSDKPRHRMRQTRNLLIDAVEHEVSASTQRIPGYEVDPSTGDPDKIEAAGVAEKVLRWGYDAWDMGLARERCVALAVVAREAFAWPYFDNQIGPPLPDPTPDPDMEPGETPEPGETLCEGDIRIRVYTGNQVFWEPGVRFEDSRWHAVEEARPIDQVKLLPGFAGGTLSSDASTSQTLQDPSVGNMVMVTDYLERPSPKTPDGLRLTVANGRIICPPEPYPCCEGDGTVVDEPVLHKISRIVDPDNDRDMGLVEHALDAQRVYNDCLNKMVEWKNLALNPQMFLMNGQMKQRLTDEPGAVFTLLGNSPPIWRPVPQIPPELSEMMRDAVQFIHDLFAQTDIPAQVSAAQAINALIAADENRRAGWVKRLAEWDSRLARHCLYLVQRFYTEDRIVKVNGMFGPDDPMAFRGADLMGEADVTVDPSSIVPRTRESITQTVMNYAQLGWVNKDDAIYAIEHGTTDMLIQGYELDLAKAWRQIRRIKGMANMQTAADMIPVASQFDDPAVHLYVLGSWMKTQDYEAQPPWVQQAAQQLAGQYQTIQQGQQQQAMQAQAAQAEQMGAQNATRPAGATPLPSLPATK